jgi:hypothetical protein
MSSIQNRISQIQSMIQGRVSNMSNQISSKPLNFQEIMNSHIAEFNPAATASLGSVTTGVANIKPFAQSNGISCGQTSVAMAVNSLTGKSLTDMDIDQKYGFGLLNALNAETQSAGVNWKDGGTISSSAWSLIEQKVNQEKLPVIVGLNGPEFSPSGRGHIVTITRVEGDTVTYADPASGTTKTTTRDKMNNAPSHPDGNFIFYGTREGGVGPAVAMNQMNTQNMLPFLNGGFKQH